MPNTLIKRIVCPKCNESCEAKLYLTVNATNSPRFRDDTLDEKLFKWLCVSCGHEARLTYPFLYNDMKLRFMIYMIPNVDNFQLVDDELEKKYSAIKNIRKRLAPDFNVLKEKIFIFESGLDDMAVELTKLAISETVARKYGLNRAEEGYLSTFNRTTNSLGFTFFLGDEKETYIQSAQIELYGKSMRIVNDLEIREKKIDGFFKIDREWADNVLIRYKKLKEEHRDDS